MSGQGPSDDRTTDDEGDGSETFFEGVRDAHVRRDGGPTGGERAGPGWTSEEVTTRTGERSEVPDRHEGRGSGYRVRLGPSLDEYCPTTPAIREAATLGTLAHVGPATESRYGTERCVRHTTSDEESHRVRVRACRLVEEDTGGCADALTGQLHRWTTVSDVEGVVPVRDRGGDERPWVLTGSTGQTLCGRDTPSVGRGLRQATRLTRTLAELHDRGVVHAGIDPGNVVLTGGDDALAPAFNNVGLADVYRRYEDPANVLDPRYAAPEYFETDRGIVDRATDIYGLGVVCFRLLTGVAPITGSAAQIADRVTDDDPLPRPSRVDPRLPATVDDVILTATATDKHERFDTAREFHEALVAVVDGC